MEQHPGRAPFAAGAGPSSKLSCVNMAYHMPLKVGPLGRHV